jgi:hypothetical protein
MSGWLPSEYLHLGETHDHKQHHHHHLSVSQPWQRIILSSLEAFEPIIYEPLLNIRFSALDYY